MNVYKFMGEVADRRSSEYKFLDNQLTELENKYGKESKEVNDFFDKEIVSRFCGCCCTKTNHINDICQKCGSDNTRIQGFNINLM
jgi:hypothetical protein